LGMDRSIFHVESGDGPPTQACEEMYAYVRCVCVCVRVCVCALADDETLYYIYAYFVFY
jgi:hypothetical protein